MKTTCLICGQKIEFAREDAGRVVPCPSCQNKLILNARAPEPVSRSETCRTIKIIGAVAMFIGVALVGGFSQLETECFFLGVVGVMLLTAGFVTLVAGRMGE